MTIEMLLAAVIGGAIGLAELVARYRDKPVGALLSPGGLLFIFVNASASIVALIAVTAAGWTFGLPPATPPASLMVVRVIAAGIGSAAILRMSFAPAHSKAAGTGPITLLKALFSTMMEAHDARYIARKNFDRTIPIPTQGVRTTDFGIDPRRSRTLRDSGRRAAERFFEQWDFQKWVQAHRRPELAPEGVFQTA